MASVNISLPELNVGAIFFFFFRGKVYGEFDMLSNTTYFKINLSYCERSKISKKNFADN